jgi:hypothetical protein
MHSLASPLLATAALFASPLAAPAAAATGEPLEADYVVRWSGIEIGRFTTELRRNAERYHLAYRARTSGPLRWLVGLESDGWAIGRLVDGGVEAEHFRGESSWRTGNGSWRISFAEDGRATEVTVDAATRADREPVPEPLRRGPDPLSLMLGAMQAASAGEVVEGYSFDGRRAVRYTLSCGTEASPIQPVALGATPRDALACSADGELVAGRSKRWGDRVDAENRDREPVRIWLVPELGGMPHWPVRIEAESSWGTVTVELERFTDPAA